MVLDRAGNDVYMRRFIVGPVEASDEEIAAFIDPYIVVELIRRDTSVVIVYYSEDHGLSEFRRRIDAWEAARWASIEPETEQQRRERFERYLAELGLDDSEPELW